MTARGLLGDCAICKIGPEASPLKIGGTQISQEISQLQLESAGPTGLACEPASLDGRTEHAVNGDDDAAPLASRFFNLRKITIFGGSNEVQRNVISKMILGL